jgi:hypothetical protein
VPSALALLAGALVAWRTWPRLVSTAAPSGRSDVLMVRNAEPPTNEHLVADRTLDRPS